MRTSPTRHLRPRLIAAGDESTLMNTVESSWQEKHLLGYGYDIVRSDVVSSALEPFRVTSNPTRDEFIYIRSVTDEHEMGQELSVSVKGDYTLDGVDIGVSAGYIDNIEASSTSISLIAEYSSTATGYELADAAGYQLTPAAQSLFDTQGQAAFQAKYGNYFIAGHRMGAKFFAVYRCSSSNYKEFQEFKAELSVNAPELFEANGAMRFATTVKNKNIQVEIRIHMVGVPAAVPRPPIDKLSPEKVLAVLDWFRSNQTGQPVDTMFMSYANVLTDYSNKIDVRPDLLSRLRLIYANYWLIKFLYRSLPPYYQNAHRTVYLNLCSDIEAKHDLFMTDGVLLDDYYTKTELMILMLQEIRSRENLYHQIATRLQSDPEPAVGVEVWEKPDNVFAYGMTVLDDTTRSLVLQETSERLLPDVAFAHVEARFDWENGNRVIVGWRVHSEKTNNGYWTKTSSAPGALGHELRLFFRSEFWRGIHYGITVFSIDKSLFHFGALGNAAEAPSADNGARS